MEKVDKHCRPIVSTYDDYDLWDDKNKLYRHVVEDILIDIAEALNRLPDNMYITFVRKGRSPRIY